MVFLCGADIDPGMTYPWDGDDVSMIHSTDISEVFGMGFSKSIRSCPICNHASHAIIQAAENKKLKDRLIAAKQELQKLQIQVSQNVYV